jgi:hypothetical protein
MLTITAGCSRREFLTIGSLGFGSLAMSSLVGRRAMAAPAPPVATGKSVIFLFLQGGPSQLETFDPKLDVPDGQRTATGVIDTSLPGITFGEKLPQLAKLADRLAVIRSYQSNNGGHNIKPLVSDDSLNANIGSLFARVVGSTRPESGMPTNAVVFPDAACDDVLKGKARGDIAATGQLGSVYAPFLPGAGGQLQRNMRLNLPRERFVDRQDLIGQLSSLSREIDAAGELGIIDALQRQAYQVLLSGGVADALDLSTEDEHVVARYDTARYARADGWSKARRGQQGMYDGHARAIGRQLLLARRLCEAGCGYVTIHDGYDGVWDMHGDGNNLGIVDGMEACGPAFDHAVAAFIEDVEARGLSDKIMLVISGEMGRTPKINRRGGRDHWGKSTPLVLYGGGAPKGAVIGRSTRDGAEPAGDPLGPKHLVSTILHTLFDPAQLRLVSGLDQISRLAEHPPLCT